MMSNQAALIKQTFEEGKGVFRLNPLFIPRPFSKAGNRMRLHPDDYYPFGLERGSIKERWFASVVKASNGPDTTEDEGLSYIAVNYNSDKRFTLLEAVAVLGADLIGKELIDKYGTWPMYAKFFDYEYPLFHHLHPSDEDAAAVGKLGKPEAYFYPRQLNNHGGDFPHTYFGFAPGTTQEEVKQKLRDYNKGDTRITELSRAYRLELGTGWYTPAGVIHAPGSYLTYEPQWNSDVNSVWENVVSGEINPWSVVVSQIPPEKANDIDYIFGLLRWEKNIDPYYKENYFRPPVNAVTAETHKEDWISYENEGYFGAKELTIYPGQEVIIKDPAAYGIIFVQGYGKFGAFDCETPTLLRFGQQSNDEFFVSENAAKEGVKITNLSKVEPLVGLKHFGPNYTEGMPRVRLRV